MRVALLGEFYRLIFYRWIVVVKSINSNLFYVSNFTRQYIFGSTENAGHLFGEVQKTSFIKIIDKVDKYDQ